MANIYKGTLGLVGNTPLVEVINIEKDLGLEATILGFLQKKKAASCKKRRHFRGHIFRSGPLWCN